MINDTKRLYRIAGRLWLDDVGSVLSAELTLLTTVLVIGLVVGAKSFRDSAITEWADYAQAIGNIDQSYNIPDVYDSSGNLVIQGGHFIDERDAGDDLTTTGNTLAHPGSLGMGDVIATPAKGEGQSWP